MLSVCGVNCSTDCKAYQTECAGCNELGGKVSWAEFYGSEYCPIYSCAKALGYLSCSECKKPPCEIWYSTKNPDMTDEEFAADIESRLKNLREMI
jgi:hypothetical protein